MESDFKVQEALKQYQIREHDLLQKLEEQAARS
jgi:hypothetical protein